MAFIPFLKRCWPLALVGLSGLILGLGLAQMLPAIGLRDDRLEWSATLSAQRPSELDLGFLHSMIQHHDQAMVMGLIVREGRDSPVRRMADLIVLKQMRESSEVRGWLVAWGEPVITSASDPMFWVLEVGRLSGRPTSLDDEALRSLCLSSQRMPGQPDTTEIEALRRAQGPAQERLFLELMVRHHQGAIAMAQFALRHGQSSLALGLANAVITDQRKELASLQRLLDALG